MFKGYKVYSVYKVINRFVLDSVRIGPFSGITKIMISFNLKYPLMRYPEKNLLKKCNMSTNMMVRTNG